MAVAQRICAFCARPLSAVADVRRKYCNDTCKAAQCSARARADGRSEKWAAATAARKRRAVLTLCCEVCGGPMSSKFAGRRYCSNRCTAKASYRRRRNTPEFWAAHNDAVRRRRARQRGVIVEQFTSAEIFERDGYRCHICSQNCPPTARVPDPMAPTIDHLIPLSRGGPHTRANVATACFYCNSVKGDRVADAQLAAV